MHKSDKPDIPASRTSRAFALFSVVVAVLHTVWETWFHLRFGQYLPMLIVDYIAIGLLLLGAAGLLRWRWGPGLLCGAWGFEFCLNYRTFFIRLYEMQQGTASEATVAIAYALGGLLVFSAAAFALSAAISIRQHREAASAALASEPRGHEVPQP